MVLCSNSFTLFIILQIFKHAKILSLCFQKEEIDIVYVVNIINGAKKQFKLISNKSCEELPMIKQFIDKAQQSEEEIVTI